MRCETPRNQLLLHSVPADKADITAGTNPAQRSAEGLSAVVCTGLEPVIFQWAGTGGNPRLAHFRLCYTPMIGGTMRVRLAGCALLVITRRGADIHAHGLSQPRPPASLLPHQPRRIWPMRTSKTVADLFDLRDDVAVLGSVDIRPGAGGTGYRVRHRVVRLSLLFG